MTVSTMSLEAAKALKAADYPQGQWPQFAWARFLMPNGEPRHGRGTFALAWRVSEPAELPGKGSVEWHAAPDPLTALTWLAKEHRLEINIRVSGEFIAGDCWAHDEYGEELAITDTPDALIIAICKRLTIMGTAAVAVE